MALVAGVGINDMRGQTSYLENGERKRLTSYVNWKTMLFRAYDRKFYRPTYDGCSVADQWHTFSSFFEWHNEHYTEGWVLDKDILEPGNKVYGPETCVYVPAELNAFVACKMIFRGDQPLGVRYRDGKYTAQISDGINGRQKHLGNFSTAQEAHNAWYTEKMRRALEYKEICDSIRQGLFDGLVQNIKNLKEEN